MGIYDQHLLNTATEIIENGHWQKLEDVRAKWEDGTLAPAKAITGVQWVFGPDEVPVPTQKELKDKSAKEEGFWIWQDKSNVVQVLRDRGSKIWDKWEQKEGDWAGTIGPAYGWQLGQKCRLFPVDKLRVDLLNPKEQGLYEYQKESGEWFVYLDQVDYMLQTLANNPGSRRILTTLWVPKDLDKMSLTPCVYETNWQYIGDLLELHIGVRSNDLCVGNPFNVFQYFVIQRLVAQVLGLEPGKLVFKIDNMHIYDRHFDLLAEQLERPIHESPKLWIDPTIKNFYEFTSDHIKLIDYKHEPFIKYEVAE